MQKHILPLAKKFITIPAEDGNTKGLNQILAVALAQLRGFSVEKFVHNGIPSALVYNTPRRPKKFTLILNGHLDNVPGTPDQYRPLAKGNKLYGAGSMDMKANTAAMIMAFKAMATSVDYPLALQLVTDEEVGGFDGTKFQVDKGVRADFVIAGEPTNFDIVNQAKGILWLKISARGKTAHGAYPWRGDNAIWKMNDFLNRLQKQFPTPTQQRWISTINLNNISTTNTAWNKIPSDCVAQLDVRFIPEDAKAIIQRLRAELPRGVKMEILVNEPALQTDPKDHYVQALRKAVRQTLKKNTALRPAQGSSDARHFARVNCPGVEFGPIGKGIGSDAEWVDIRSLDTFYNILLRFMRSL